MPGQAIIPDACRYFRMTIADPGHTRHDLSLAIRHADACPDCENVIGKMIHDATESPEQIRTSGA